MEAVRAWLEGLQARPAQLEAVLWLPMSLRLEVDDVEGRVGSERG